MSETVDGRRLRLVRKHGYNGLALLTLYDGWRYFEPSDIDGFVAFELHRRVAVACGDPVCAPNELPALIERFAEYCSARGWRFSFVGASARCGAAAARLGLQAVKVGEEPFFDLAAHSFSGKAAKKARSAINLARRSGIVVEEYCRPHPGTDTEILDATNDWLRTRQAQPMGFLLRSRPLARREEKRIFTATYEGRIVGAITCSPAPARGLLYVEEVIRRHDAPYGTSELLIDAARAAAKQDGYALLSLGTAPLHGATAQPLGKHRVLTLLFRGMTSRLNFVYSFRSLNHYKKKFAPTFWEDNFFVYQGSIAFAALGAVSAFAPEGLPSLLLPKRLQWLRLVPGAALAACAVAGVFVTGFAFWQFPELQAPARIALSGVLLTRAPGDRMFDAATGHRILSSVVLLAIGAGAWARRARA